MRIDAHLHLWDRSLGVYSWLGPQHGRLDDDFGPDEALAELDRAGLDAAILVQAADAEADSRALLSLAGEQSRFAGVVGWIDLEQPDQAAESIARLRALGPLVGVRQMVHDDPRPDVLALPEVIATAHVLADQSLSLDVPDAFPRQLGGALTLARAVPELTLVLDHLGKPPAGAERLAWSTAVRRLAESSPSVVAKVSGLQGIQPFSAEGLRPAWEFALDVLGPSRLMFGSDWPMTIDGPGYGGTVEVIGSLIDELSPDEQAQLWSGTAIRTYRSNSRGGDPDVARYRPAAHR